MKDPSPLFSVAVNGRHDESELGRKGFISASASRSESITEGSQGRDHGECCFLACCLVLSQQASFYSPDLPALEMVHPIIAWALHINQLKQFLRDTATGQSDGGNSSATGQSDGGITLQLRFPRSRWLYIMPG